VRGGANHPPRRAPPSRGREAAVPRGGSRRLPGLSGRGGKVCAADNEEKKPKMTTTKKRLHGLFLLRFQKKTIQKNEGFGLCSGQYESLTVHISMYCDRGEASAGAGGRFVRPVTRRRNL